MHKNRLQYRSFTLFSVLVVVFFLGIETVPVYSSDASKNVIADLMSGDKINIILEVNETCRINLANRTYNITLTSVSFEEPYKITFIFKDQYNNTFNFLLTKGPTVSLSTPINLSIAHFVSFNLLKIISSTRVELTVFFEEREIPPEDIIQCNAINNETDNFKENSSPENIEPQIADAKEDQALESKILKQILELKSVENLSNLSNQSNKTDEKTLSSIQEVKGTDKDDKIFINTSKDKDSSFLPDISDTNSWLLAVILTIIFFFLTLRIILKKR